MTNRLQYLFIVMVADDGAIQIDRAIPDGVEASRVATLNDIVDASRKITADIDRDLVVQQVVEQVRAALTPEDPTTVADRVRAAVASRRAVETAPEAETDDPE